MAPGLLPARSSKCVACLVMVAGAALGTVGGEAYAGGQAGSAAGAVSLRPSTNASDAPSAPSSPPASAGPSALPSAPPSALPSGPATLRPAGSGPLASSEAATPSGASDDAPAKPPGSPPTSASDPAAPPPSASVSASASASASEPPLAGQVAGEGRARPGRSLSPLELARAEAPLDEDVPEPDATDVPVYTPPPSAFPESRQASAQALDARAVRQVQQISLGAGIALVGLGLGFLAFRMRRGH
ncbi:MULTISPECIES: hypothetical protein [unclassified Streptomyces]|uniref:hypothetical protein n=1 Tax=unclassified Streptomyces TaxID=2593676 RepID=UPI000939BFBA|nr:hypothetical protein [Streptomyces sp. TSRI0281]OKI32868.1 hypothetical protein A6A29_20690 [Streptomyces sp. TSRI0281]